MIKPALATTITSLLVCLNIAPCFAGTTSSRTSTTSSYSSSTESVAERELRRRYEYVQNGEAAIEILDREKRVDLMISDVVMPTMDGPTTAREARLRQPDLPILFISGYAEEQLRKSIDIPNVAFLPKPFSVQQLAQTVRDVLDRK